MTGWTIALTLALLCALSTPAPLYARGGPPAAAASVTLQVDDARSPASPAGGAALFGDVLHERQLVRTRAKHAKRARSRSGGGPAASEPPPAGKVERGKPQSHIERIETALRYLADELKRGPAVESILGGSAEHMAAEDDGA